MYAAQNRTVISFTHLQGDFDGGNENNYNKLRYMYAVFTIRVFACVLSCCSRVTELIK